MKMNRLINIVFALMIPFGAFAQKSIFDNSEATVGSIRNLSQFASTDENAVIYNPAGLAFSDEVFQISLGCIGGYQQIENKPFLDSDYTIADMPHRSSIIRATPSFQSYYRFGNLSLSLSFANEGGGGVWRDQYGNAVMDSFFHEYENRIDEWNLLRSLLQPYMVYDEDVVRLYSEHFRSEYSNTCVRIGLTYKFSKYFSGYLGCKNNNLYYDDETGMSLYVQRQTTNERWLISDYLLSTIGLVNVGNGFDTLVDKITSSVSGDSWGNRKTFTYAPVIGFGFNYNNLNVGMKYEMSPNLLDKNNDIRIPHDLSIGAAYSLFDNILKLSAGADFKWGYIMPDSLDKEAMIHILQAEEAKLLYSIVIGADWQINKRFLLSASTAYGNTCYSMRGSGSYNEINVKKKKFPDRFKFSLGAQFRMNDHLRLDAGISMDIFTLTARFNTLTNFINSGITVTSHCDYHYLPRFAAGIGLTYDF